MRKPLILSQLALIFVCIAAEEGRAHVFPIRWADRDESKHRQLEQLREPLQGSVALGYYTAEVTLGSPGRSFSAIVDSGSSLLYIPCDGCKHCGNHDDAPFDPESSNTFEELQCSAPQCSLYCGSHCCRRNANTSPCEYEVRYAESSAVFGTIVSDQLALSATSSARITFGCQTTETGAIYAQKPDGIIGLAASPASVPAQLAAQNATAPQFSLCYAVTDAGGCLVLGDLPSEAHTPWPAFTVPRSRVSHDNMYYNVQLAGVALGAHALEFSPAAFEAGFGTVLDSGTTFSFFPDATAAAFDQQLRAYVKQAAFSRITVDGASGFCFETPGHRKYAQLSAALPNMTLIFADGQDLSLRPQSYLYAPRLPQPRRHAIWCSSLLSNGPSGALIGGAMLRDVLVTYDNTPGSDTIRMRSVPSCAEYTDDLMSQRADSTDAKLPASPAGGKAPGGSVEHAPPNPADDNSFVRAVAHRSPSERQHTSPQGPVTRLRRVVKAHAGVLAVLAVAVLLCCAVMLGALARTLWLQRRQGYQRFSTGQADIASDDGCSANLPVELASLAHSSAASPAAATPQTRCVNSGVQNG